MRGLLGAVAALALSSCSASGDRFADPLTVAPPETPNWALAAPRGVESRTAPTRVAPVFDASPSAVIAGVEAVAQTEPRIERVRRAGATALEATYVQRSMVFRFPDRVSVRALDLGGGKASLAIYSVSVYGSSDFGVNAARLDRWLAALEAEMATK